MKKRIVMMALILTAGLFVGCGREETKGNILNIESIPSESEEQAGSESGENNDITLDDEMKIDFTYDYSEDIKADVDYVVSGSVSLQKELENIEKIIQKYTPLAEAAQTQGEMNVSSKWFFVIWDTELNNIWSRFTDLADQQIKDKVLAEMKRSLGGRQETSGHDVNQSAEQNDLKPEQTEPEEPEEPAETELAFQIADRYISIQETEGGYDYSIMGLDYKEIDGGVYDNPGIGIKEAINEIVEDLKIIPFDNGARGNIRDNDDLMPIDYEELIKEIRLRSE